MTATEVIHQIDSMSDEQFLQQALQSVGRDFGLYGLARFVSIYRPRTGNYTDERHEWQDKMTEADLETALQEASTLPR